MYQTITKTIVAWLFNNYVAYYYFDNINISQLKVAFNNGQVELEDLPIKQDALRHLRIPWKVISGTVGRLVIQIPVLSLLTEPWDITLSNLTLIVSPNYKSQMKMIQESSQSNITDYLDEPSLNDNLMPNSEETKLAEFYKSFSSTVSSMVKDVFRNIRLEIGSIQIIFEDNKAGVTKFEAEKILLVRPDSERRLLMNNAFIYFSEIGSSLIAKRKDLFRFKMCSCDLEIRDVTHGENQSSFEFISDYNIVGDLYIDGAPSIPVANFLLEDFRLLYFSCDQQHDGSLFARISCWHFNQESSSWDTLLQPWPFNLSWDKRVDLRRISITSDELAEFSIDSALLDLIDVIIKRITVDSTKSKLWPQNLRRLPKKVYESSPQDYKLTYYNYNTNLAQKIGGRSARQLFNQQSRNTRFDFNFIGPGIKLTLWDNSHERLIEIAIDNIVFKSTTRAKEQIIDCSIQDVRIENLLPDCERSIVLDRASTPPNQSLNGSPAFRLIIDRILGRSFGTVWFKQVQVSMCELFLNIEEKLFLKLFEFISFRNRKPKRDMGNISRNLDKIMHPEEERLSKYYFDLLRIDLSSLTLSVYPAETLPDTLQRLKTIAGLNFFGFEDARVQLAPYFKMNVSRTLGGIFDSVTRCYKRQISEQTPRIVGQQIQNYLRFHLSDLLSSLYDEVYNKLFY